MNPQSFPGLWLAIVIQVVLICQRRACEDLVDGYYDFKLMSDKEYNSVKETTGLTAPIVNAYCNSNYMVIDVNHSANFIDYFSSFHAFAIPSANTDLQDRVSWRRWFLPTRKDELATFAVTTTDCLNCDLRDESGASTSTSTVYHSTLQGAGCITPFKCAYRHTAPYTCSECAGVYPYQDVTGSGYCTTVPMSDPDFVTTLDFKYCQQYKPPAVVNSQIVPTLASIGTQGYHCVCYKPSAAAAPVLITGTAKDAQTQLRQREQKEQKEQTEQKPQPSIQSPSATIKTKTFNLYQKDFAVGTYRIFESGIYNIMEDIVFDFQAGDLSDPNAAGAWSIDASFADDYDGAGSWDGYYWLGFFAGITVEADDVTIDLNGHTLAQSRAFYLQQRFFIHICLNNKIFEDERGPTFFGYDLQSFANIAVTNGVLGLSSHIGLFGITVTNLTVTDLQVRDFETHGILLNGFTHLHMENVDIGPSVATQLRVSANYNLARFFLPQFRSFADDDNGAHTITFGNGDGRDDDGGPLTMDDLVDNLVRDMDLAFHWAYEGARRPGYTDAVYDKALQLFANEYGLPTHSALFGLVLRPLGASVFSWFTYHGTTSTDGTLENITIHDLVNMPVEVVAMKAVARNQISAPVPWNDHGLSSTHGYHADSQYIGNSLLDLFFAQQKFTTNWWYLGRTTLQSELLEWVVSGEPYDYSESMVDQLVCGMDAGGHTPKGVAAFKFERCVGVTVNNMRIRNIVNVAAPASELCGDYVSFVIQTFGAATHNYGYSGNHARGISVVAVRDVQLTNIDISNVMSLTGPAFGIYVHSDVYGRPFSPPVSAATIAMNGVSIAHIDSGLGAAADGVDYSAGDAEPRWPTAGCAISCENESMVADDNCQYGVYASSDIEISQINGQSYCSICNLGTDTDANARSGSQSCLSAASADASKHYTQEYETWFGTYSIRNGMSSLAFTPSVNYQKIANQNKNNNKINKRRSQGSATPMMVLMLGVASILVSGWYLYHYSRGWCNKRVHRSNDENQPLLI